MQSKSVDRFKSPIKNEVQKQTEGFGEKDECIKTRTLFEMKFKTQALKESQIGMGLSKVQRKLTNMGCPPRLLMQSINKHSK